MENEKKEYKICYGSWHEIERMTSIYEPKDYVDIPNYISSWAEKCRKVDLDGEIARKMAKKFSK